MSKIDQLADRLAELHVEMERRFGQITTALLLLSVAVILATGPHSLAAQLLWGTLR